MALAVLIALGLLAYAGVVVVAIGMCKMAAAGTRAEALLLEQATPAALVPLAPQPA